MMCEDCMRSVFIGAVGRWWLVMGLSKFDDAFEVYIHSTLYALEESPLAAYAFLSRLVSTCLGSLTTMTKRLVCLLLTSLAWSNAMLNQIHTHTPRNEIRVSYQP